MLKKEKKIKLKTWNKIVPFQISFLEFEIQFENVPSITNFSILILKLDNRLKVIP